MLYRLVADAIAVVHLGFILFIALGGLLAWRWPRLLWLHVAAVAWGAGIVTIGWTCPLTPAEQHFRRLGGEDANGQGFVDRYIEGVIYPERYASLLRALVAVLVVIGWAGLLHRQMGLRKQRA